MNQYVIDLPGVQPGLRSTYPGLGDARSPGVLRGGPVRPAWPFLVNSGSRGNQQPGRQEAGNSSGFAS
jgi:hypothetical protein